jgi:hypothetical protein
MSSTLGTKRLCRLDVQGFDSIDKEHLAEVGPWLRMAFALCATLAIVATALASRPLLFTLAAIAFLAAILPVHPFDLIYNYGIRRLTGTRRLPKRGPPNRFACGVGALWVIVTIGAFDSPYPVVGYVLGFTLAAVALLVSTMDICIPSMIFRAIFGSPVPRPADTLDDKVAEPPLTRRDHDHMYRP